MGKHVAIPLSCALDIFLAGYKQEHVSRHTQRGLFFSSLSCWSSALKTDDSPAVCSTMVNRACQYV